MARVLITGGFGFIGSSLARRCLLLGHQVTLLSKSLIKVSNVDTLNCHAIIKDVCQVQTQDVQGYDWLFHCASTVDNYNILSDPWIDTQTNCLGTLAILRACLAGNPEIRIVFPSTFFVNGNLKEFPATPESPCNPLGLYGATKLAAEYFCRIYHSVFGLNTIVARLVNIFGPGEQRNNNKKAALNRMISLAVESAEIKLYGENALRDILYIDDAVDGLIALMEHERPGQTCYVGSGVGTKIGEFIEIAVEQAGGGTISHVETPSFHLATGIGHFWCDPSPLMSLGWKPKISIKEGIRRTIASYRSDNG